MSLIETARQYASDRHAQVNHHYGDHPYAFHLAMVASYAQRYITDLPAPQQAIILAGCWCHDLIEDARETYNDLKAVVGPEVAELAYALTNEKGRTRAERADDRYYAGIRATPYAPLVKVCDRLANMDHSIQQQSRMADIYAREYPQFRQKLYQSGQYEAAWADLDALVQQIGR